MNKIKIRNTLIILLFGFTNSYATSYQLPPNNEALIGKVRYHITTVGENVITLAKQYDLGYNAVESANPHMNMARGFTPGNTLQIPSQYLIPNQPRQGIVINLPEMRMYYYPKGSHEVVTYPIGIGKIGKTIPITKTRITGKIKDPTWIPPQDIREFNLEQGIVLPSIMPPGPDNPLGSYAIYMRIPTYLMHSTIFPESVGRRASFGCIRMYESDIQSLFPSVYSGIPVVIINSPIKVAWQKNRLYMEAHYPLEEYNDSFDASLPGIVHFINDSSKNKPILIDWQLVSYIVREKDGLPYEIGFTISSNN
ncbi:MAG TPA: L,D-transpeptidase family protein [Gammaproteobacteria bacterium]|nr:L,D-transpeptidase family protein [Gammaproteobacteria bacterium]